MKYTMTEPCSACPFLKKMKHGFAMKRLKEFASGEFVCHRTADLDEETNTFIERDGKNESQHCAGALIFNEKRNQPTQMMRICERLGLYDRTKLNMGANIR